MAMKYFKVGLEEDLYEKFLATCTGKVEQFLVDEDGKPIADPSEKDLADATAKRDAVAKESVMQMMIRNGMAATVRNRLVAEADRKMKSKDDDEALGGIKDKRALENFSIEIEEL